MSNWKTFPHNNSEFLFAGEQLLDSWPDLHSGDCVAYPDADWVEQCLEQAPDAAPASFDGDYFALAVIIQDAWRCFHAGDFEKAVELAA